jgi:hypothetical protein
MAGFMMRHREAFSQGAVYWQHDFASGMTSRGWVGRAETPGSFIYGGDVFYPFHPCLALALQFNYALASGTPTITPARDNWSMSFGVCLSPCGTYASGDRRFRPPLPLANAGSLFFREHF